MPIDITKKRIIMIHGLASKPPQKVLDELWTHCLVENIRVNDKALAKALDTSPETFLSGYWANATPHHIEDDAGYVKKLRVQVADVIAQRRKMKDKFHVGFGEKVGAFLHLIAVRALRLDSRHLLRPIKHDPNTIMLAQ